MARMHQLLTERAIVGIIAGRIIVVPRRSARLQNDGVRKFVLRVEVRLSDIPLKKQGHGHEGNQKQPSSGRMPDCASFSQNWPAHVIRQENTATGYTPLSTSSLASTLQRNIRFGATTAPRHFRFVIFAGMADDLQRSARRAPAICIAGRCVSLFGSEIWRDRNGTLAQPSFIKNGDAAHVPSAGLNNGRSRRPPRSIANEGGRGAASTANPTRLGASDARRPRARLVTAECNR